MSSSNDLQDGLTSVLIMGSLWGIFEATVGYAIHLLPVSIGFLVWYPTAVFFLAAVYGVSGKKTAILCTAALAAAIKLLNLLLPGRIDRVLNPAVSILLEGLAVFAAVTVFERLEPAKKPRGLLLVSVGMNTMWRLLYLGYLAYLVPAWIREASVLKSAADLIRFIAVDNLCSSLIVFAGMLIVKQTVKRRPELPRAIRSLHAVPRGAAMAALLALNIALELAG